MGARYKRGKGVLDRGESLCKSIREKKQQPAGAQVEAGKPGGMGSQEEVLREGLPSTQSPQSAGVAGEGQAWALLAAGGYLRDD